MLISRSSEVVSAEALIDAIWDGTPPRSAAKTLQGYVVHLRHALQAGGAGPRTPIVTRRGGYAETAAELAPSVARAAEPGDVVMVKGSNGSKAGLIAQALGQLDVRPREAG